MLFRFANAVSPAFVRFTPPSARAAATLRMSRSPRLLSGGTPATSKKHGSSKRCLTNRWLIRRQSGSVGRVKISVSSRFSIRCRAAANSDAASALRVP